MNNQVSVCCLDYKKMTTFANIMETSMDNIYQQYVDIINIMRTKGSPFECSRCSVDIIHGERKLLEPLSLL